MTNFYSYFTQSITAANFSQCASSTVECTAV